MMKRRNFAGLIGLSALPIGAVAKENDDSAWCNASLKTDDRSDLFSDKPKLSIKEALNLVDRPCSICGGAHKIDRFSCLDWNSDEVSMIMARIRIIFECESCGDRLVVRMGMGFKYDELSDRFKKSIGEKGESQNLVGY